jgi:hypothetical protein
MTPQALAGPQGGRHLSTADCESVTMSHMKEISIRELHRNTGAWVRSARKYGSILVTARAEHFDRIYSNDKHLLRACASLGLKGIDPT